jgi:competence protein ComEC
VTSTKNRNDLSCVLKITTKAHSLLLTGDIENAAEKRLVQSVGQDLKSDIMVVPHHGSLTSSSQEFLNKVAPKYALYPVGLDNQYGFPKAGVLDRYESIGALNLQVYRTGALTFVLKTTGNIDPPSHWRERSHRYWHTAI